MTVVVSPHALVVDDDAVSRMVLTHMLRRSGWLVTEAGDVPEAAGLVGAEHYDAVFSDYSLPSGTGLEVLEALETRASNAGFVLITGFVEHVSIDAAYADRVHHQLTKPISSRTLARVLHGLQPPDPD